MAQLANTQITVNGTKITQFSQLSLTQGISEHHSFQLTCLAEAIDGTSGSVFQTSRNFIGAPINIKITSIETAGEMNFDGLVTQVETSRFGSHAA